MNTRDEVRQMRIREWKKVFEDKCKFRSDGKQIPLTAVNSFRTKR